MEDNCNEAIPWFKYGNRQAGPISFKALQRLWPRIFLSPGYEQAHALAKQKTDQLQSESHLCPFFTVIIEYFYLQI